MAHNNPFSAFFTNDQIQETLEKYKCSTLDFGELLEINRKNLQTLAKAQQLGLQNAQALTNKQMEIISQFIQDQTNATSDILCEGKPEEKIIKNSERVQKSYKKAMADLEEITAIIKEANSKTSRLLKDQTKENIKTAATKANGATSKATKTESSAA